MLHSFYLMKVKNSLICVYFYFSLVIFKKLWTPWGLLRVQNKLSRGVTVMFMCPQMTYWPMVKPGSNKPSMCPWRDKQLLFLRGHWGPVKPMICTALWVHYKTTWGNTKWRGDICLDKHKDIDMNARRPILACANPHWPQMASIIPDVGGCQDRWTAICSEEHTGTQRSQSFLVFVFLKQDKRLSAYGHLSLTSCLSTIRLTDLRGFAPSHSRGKYQVLFARAALFDVSTQGDIIDSGSFVTAIFIWLLSSWKLKTDFNFSAFTPLCLRLL